MKYFMTILCALAFTVAGVSLAVTEHSRSSSFKHQTISAATMPEFVPPSQLPLDLQLDLEKKYKKVDTVYIEGTTDTIYVEVPQQYKPKQGRAHTLARAAAKRQGLDPPALEPDVPAKSQVCGDREEYSPDTIGPPKVSIILTVDGEEVYKR